MSSRLKQNPAPSPSEIRLHGQFMEAMEWHRQGRLAEAQALFAQIVRKQPRHHHAVHFLGVIAFQNGDFQRAVDLLTRAVDLFPESGDFNNNLGCALSELGRFGAALAAYEKALRFEPDRVDVYYNRGRALRGLGRLEEAAASFGKALELKPDYAVAWNSLGNVQTELSRFDAAIRSFSEAIALRPTDYAEAYYNRGKVLSMLLRLDEALENFDKAIAIEPGHAEALGSKSMAMLLMGNFSEGLKLYEWRRAAQAQGVPAREFQAPLWLGQEPIEGKTILLASEQGFGDVIQFSRYAKLLAERGARVALETPRPLASLLRGLAGVDRFVGESNGQGFDFYCPLLSLPLALGTRLDTVPAEPAYLHADPDKLALWADRLGPKTATRVGLVWCGNKDHVNDRNRSLPLATLRPYLDAGFEYVSLQKVLTPEDRAFLGAQTGIRHFGDALDDFSDTAALCELMDVIISVDTSVAHLAGALGRKTWIMLPYRPDWRWLLACSDSVWYPSVRLYRQNTIGDWASVLGQIRSDLRQDHP